MNMAQKKFIWMLSIAIFIMLLFPPFEFYWGEYKTPINLGYGFIFNPPYNGKGQVNIRMLVAQWSAAILIGGLGYLAAGRKTSGSAGKEHDTKGALGQIGLDDSMKKIAMAAFPGGLKQIEEETRKLHALLAGRLTIDEVGNLIRPIKALLVISEDKSPSRITASILARANGKLTSQEANLVYRFLVDIPEPTSADGANDIFSKTSSETSNFVESEKPIFINQNLVGKDIIIHGKSGSVRIDQAILTIMLLSAKQVGWKGGRVFFDESGNSIKPFVPNQSLNDNEAMELTKCLQDRLKIGALQNPNLDANMVNSIKKLLVLCSYGSITVYEVE